MTAKNAAFLSIATTGLGEDDELIYIEMVCPDENWAPRKMGACRRVAEDKLLKSAEYHKISAGDIRQYGMDDDTFRAMVQVWLDTHKVFTYNPEFTQKFLERHGLKATLFDFPQILKWIERRDIKDDAEVHTLEDMARAAKKAGSATFKNAMLQHPWPVQETWINEMLPCEQNAWKLWHLYQGTASIEALIQETFL